MSRESAPSGGGIRRALQGVGYSRNEVNDMDAQEMRDALYDHSDEISRRRYNIQQLHEEIDQMDSHDDFHERSEERDNGNVGLGTVLGLGLAGGLAYMAWTFRHYAVGYAHRYLSRVPQGQLERGMGHDRFVRTPLPQIDPPPRANPETDAFDR